MRRRGFPEGTTGAQLDAFARRPLWEAGLDYGHGTGHGVGSYLSVHEGPQSISPRGTAQALKPGMICSNEPGYYKTGEYGIRIENLVVVRDFGASPAARGRCSVSRRSRGCRSTLTVVEPSMLTDAEKAWLNDYHAAVRAAVGPVLADDAQASAWLGAGDQADLNRLDAMTNAPRFPGKRGSRHRSIECSEAVRLLNP